MDELDATLNVSPTGTRRALLRRSVALAVAAPAVASVLHLGTAFADDGDNDKDDKNKDKDKDDKKPGREPQAPRAHVNSFSSDLARVAASAASGDFSSGNAGTDPLADGRVRLRHRGNSTDEGRVQVDLRGAAASVSYDVFFWAVTSGKGREALGTIGPTNNNGNLSQLTPSALSGTSRVGVFVIVRHDGGEAGKDEFISSMGS
jgi:hypothetical protein